MATSGPLSPESTYYSSPPGYTSWNADASDPWAAPKSISTLSTISDTNAPPMYERLYANSDPSGGTVPVSSLRKILVSGEIKATQVDQIISMVSKSTRLSRNEFYAGIALLAFAQKSMELSIEAVSNAKDSLPVPYLTVMSESNPIPPSPTRSASLLSIDPWSSNPRSAPTNFERPFINHALEEEGDAELFETGFNGSEWAVVAQDKVSVVQREELGGSWMLKHTVWVVSSVKHGSVVERRYSDFVWLLDCLTKRYATRLLPALPPKHLVVAGHYISVDDLFLERRKRGLERVLNHLNNHPVLKSDALIVTFLTQNQLIKTPSLMIEEESSLRSITPAEEKSLPSDLDERLESLQSRLPSLIEHWGRITSHIDRIAHRRQNQGGEMCLLRVALEASVEVEQSGWRPDEVGRVERSCLKFAQAIGAAGETVERTAGDLIITVVEDVKRHRELYTNLKDLFVRQTSLLNDTYASHKKQAEAALKKLSQIRELRKPNWEVEADKQASIIEFQQKEMNRCLRRRAFTRWCVWQEVLWLFRCTSLLEVALQRFIQLDGEFASGMASHWQRALENWGS